MGVGAASGQRNLRTKVWGLIALVLVVLVAKDLVSRQYTVTTAAYLVRNDARTGRTMPGVLIGGPYPTDCGSGLRVIATGGALRGCAGNRDAALARLLTGTVFVVGAAAVARRGARNAR